MNKFEISADSTCDLYKDEAVKLGVYLGRLNFVIEQGKDTDEYLDDFSSYEEYVEFYQKLKGGAVARTSILNLQAHIDLFTKMAEDGVENALHFSQSKGLSPTIDNAVKAIEIVKEKYPNINYLAVDTNTTTVGEGMLVKLACKLRDQGKTNAEVKEIIENEKNHIQHFVLVDDLMYLKRGGRISTVSAAFGTILNIKPIIEFSKAGKLEVVRKEKGTKKAMKSIVSEFSKYTKSENFDIVIVHTDNLPLAEELQSMIETAYGIKPEIRIMGPIIGAHVGPGAVAYAFISNEERPV